MSRSRDVLAQPPGFVARSGLGMSRPSTSTGEPLDLVGRSADLVVAPADVVGAVRALVEASRGALTRSPSPEDSVWSLAMGSRNRATPSCSRLASRRQPTPMSRSEEGGERRARSTSCKGKAASRGSAAASRPSHAPILSDTTAGGPSWPTRGTLRAGRPAAAPPLRRSSRRAGCRSGRPTAR